jgi:putative oxidoreductase
MSSTMSKQLFIFIEKKKMKFIQRFINYQPISIDMVVLLRVLTGIYFIYHGRELFQAKSMEGFASYLKNDLHFPVPLFMAYLRTSGEFFGGIMLLLGLFTRAGAFLIMVTMLVATFTAAKGEIFGEGEITFLYAIACLVLIFIGAGKYSFDYLLSKR